MDILEFVDSGCNAFIGDLCLVIAAYTDTFLQDGGEKKRRREQQVDRQVRMECLAFFLLL